MNLADIQELASVGTTKTVTLSPVSVAVLLSALEGLDYGFQWQGEGVELSNEEWDTIEAIIANCTTEILTETEIPPVTRIHEIGEPFSLFVNVPPIGALPMDGAVRLQADYPALMDKIPDFWKSGINFILPDMKGRSVVGQGFTYKTFSGTPYTVTAGGFGGKLEHTLSVDELPPHTHTVQTSGSTSGGSNSIYAPTNRLPQTTVVSSSAGNGQAHDNMPPFLAGFWFIQAE